MREWVTGYDPEPPTLTESERRPLSSSPSSRTSALRLATRNILLAGAVVIGDTQLRPSYEETEPNHQMVERMMQHPTLKQWLIHRMLDGMSIEQIGIFLDGEVYELPSKDKERYAYLACLAHVHALQLSESEGKSTEELEMHEAARRENFVFFRKYLQGLIDNRTDFLFVTFLQKAAQKNLNKMDQEWCEGMLAEVNSFELSRSPEDRVNIQEIIGAYAHETLGTIAVASRR